MASANADWELLSRIVQHNELKAALARHVTPEMFGSDLAGRVFKFIETFHRKYRKLPSLDLLSKKFPKGRLTLTAEEPPAYYLDNFIRQHLRAHGAERLLEAAQNIQDDPIATFEQLRAEAAALLGKTITTSDSSFVGDWRGRLSHYRQRKRGDLLGIPTPWDTWNQVAFGYQPEEYIVISARPGVGKTFFVLCIALYVMGLGKKVLFVTKEMSIQAVQRRSDAMEFHLPYNAFRKGTLTPAEFKRYRNGLKRKSRLQRSGEMTGDIIFVSDAHMSVASVEAKIEEYTPDLVIIDGLYLLSDLSRTSDQWQRLTNVSRETKALAQSYSVPMIVTSQIHRMPGNLEKNWQHLTLGDLAFSDALGQDADQVWALIRTETMRLQNQMMVKNLKMREEDMRDFGVHWDLASMKDTFHEIDITEDGDISEQQDRDAEGNLVEDHGDEKIEEAGGWEGMPIDEDLGETPPALKQKKTKKKRRKEAATE